MAQKTASKYYVRIADSNVESFEKHLTSLDVEHELLSHDFANGRATALYAIRMDREDAVALKLSFPLLGCMNFVSTMNRQPNIEKGTS